MLTPSPCCYLHPRNLGNTPCFDPYAQEIHANGEPPLELLPHWHMELLVLFSASKAHSLQILQQFTAILGILPGNQKAIFCVRLQPNLAG
jgi:hypothetical protein